MSFERRPPNERWNRLERISCLECTQRHLIAEACFGISWDVGGFVRIIIDWLSSMLEWVKDVRDWVETAWTVLICVDMYSEALSVFVGARRNTTLHQPYLQKS